MKWGRRKAKQYENAAKTSRESAKEWQEIGKYKASKAKSQAKADKIMNKYNKKATSDRRNAKEADRALKMEQKKNKFREARGNAYKARSKGAKLATNILGGPYANRTYNSVIAAGGSKTGARVVTGLTTIGGPLAHIAVSALYTEQAGSGGTARRY
jgi:hypothetical protein